MKRALLLGSLVALLLCGGTAQARIVDGIAAIVGDQVITISEVRDTAAPGVAMARRIPSADQRRKRIQQAWRQALDALIAEKLLATQVTKFNVEVSDDEVDQAIERIRSHNNVSEEQLKGLLAQQGLAWAQYKSDIKKQLTRMRLVEFKVRSQVSVTEEDVRNAYALRYTAKLESGELHLRRIFLRIPENPRPEDLTRARTRAVEIAKRLKAGEPFDKLARELSDGRGSANGGDMGWVKPSELLPAFAEAVVTLEVGQVSLPVRTPQGLSLLKLEERRAVDVPSFDEVAPRLQAELTQERTEQQLGRWIETLKGDTFIDIKLKVLDSAIARSGTP